MQATKASASSVRTPAMVAGRTDAGGRSAPTPAVPVPPDAVPPPPAQKKRRVTDAAPPVVAEKCSGGSVRRPGDRRAPATEPEWLRVANVGAMGHAQLCEFLHRCIDEKFTRHGKYAEGERRLYGMPRQTRGWMSVLEERWCTPEQIAKVNNAEADEDEEEDEEEEDEEEEDEEEDEDEEDAAEERSGTEDDEEEGL